MLKSLKLYGWVLLASVLACFPGALYYNSWMLPRVPAWYYSLSVLTVAVVSGFAASVAGALVLAARRDQPQRRLKPAIIMVVIAGLVVSYF